MTGLEPKYTLFDSVEQMLASETLSELLSKRITHVNYSAPSVWEMPAASSLLWARMSKGWFSKRCRSSLIGKCSPRMTTYAGQ